jgi:GTP-binding protein
MAIVHEQSGVTRDRLTADAEWQGTRFRVIDTGGLTEVDTGAPNEQIAAGIRRQVDMGLKESDAAIFVVDITAGIMPLDHEVAGLIHRWGGNVCLAANKADNPERDDLVTEFSELGFPVFPVAALHNRGFDELMHRLLGDLPEAGEEVVVKRPVRVAVVGRPNVGKSSYVNRLLRDERVLVADMPGTTRDSVEIPFSVGTGEEARHYVLVDTAGIRRRGKDETAVERYSVMRAEKSIDLADMVVVVIDAADGITAWDRRIASGALTKGRACVMLVNKWDLSKVTQRKFAEDAKIAMAGLEFVPITYASAKTGYNVRRSLETVDRTADQARQTLSTGVLNRALGAAFEAVQPPLYRGKRLKLYYAVQAGHRPIRFALFVNDPKRLAAAYRGYLINTLRKRFGFSGVPIELSLKPRSGRRSPGSVGA